MKPATLFVMMILIGVAFLHVLRLIFQLEVLVGGFSVPMWVSVGGTIAPVLLAVAMWSEHRPREVKS